MSKLSVIFRVERSKELITGVSVLLKKYLEKNRDPAIAFNRAVKSIML